MAKGKSLGDASVYLINKIDGEPKAYVGSTVNIDKRFKAYKSKLKNTYVERSITKNGWDSFQKVIIPINVRNEKELRLWEGFYIGLFGTHKNNNPEFGMNIIKNPTLAISSEPSVAKKISETKTGSKLSEEHKEKIKSSTKGKINIGIKRPYLSERNKIIKPALGRTGSKNPMSKKVLYISENKTFESIKELGDYFGISRQAVRYRIKQNPLIYKYL
jgi:group I intron endonuclease